MNAFEELRQEGFGGAATVALLIALIRQLGTSTSFPPPAGFGGWTTEAATSYLCDLLLAKNGSGFIIQCAAKAHDQASLERLLLAAIRNALIDEAKATPVGKVRRRMQGLLARDGRFVNARGVLGEDGWTLPEHGSVIWVEDLEQLNRLTGDVVVEPIERLNRGGPTPAGPRRSLLTLSFEAVRRARGAVRAQALSRLLVDRFGLDGTPTVDSDALDDGSSAVASDPSTIRLARKYFDALTDGERTMLRDPGAVAAAAAAETDPAARTLALRLRAWAGSELGRDAVGVLLKWCEPGCGSQVVSDE